MRRGPWTLVALLLAGACGDASPPPQATRRVTLEVQPAPGDRVVARVNGAPILARDLELQFVQGKAPKQALQELIQLELLAQEARRRGLDAAPGVLRAQRKAMTEAVIKQGFGEGFTHKSIPAEMVAGTYRKVKARFVHKELVRVNHIVVMADNNDPPQRHRAARKLAGEVLRRAQAMSPMLAGDFNALGAQVRSERPDFKIVVETMTTDLRGRTVAAFADAAFAMDKEAELSPVVKTRFGYHVLRFVKRIPAKDIPLAQADPAIREGIFEQARREMFLRWLGQLATKAGVKVEQEVLSRVLSGGAPAAGGG